jgi:excisionase family DNA binding protein
MTPGNPKPRPLLTVAEVARLLNVSIKTVQRYEAAGTLRPVRLSRRAVRYCPADVEAVMVPQQQTPGVATGRLQRNGEATPRVSG